MEKYFYLILCLNFGIIVSVGAQQFAWARAFGSELTDAGNATAVDDEENVITVGFLGGRADIDPGPDSTFVGGAGEQDIFILKLDPFGNFIWGKSFGGRARDRANTVAVDKDGSIYVSGFFNDTVDFDPGSGLHMLFAEQNADVFILKLDRDGNTLWARKVTENIDTSANNDVNKVAVDAKGDVYVGGKFNGLVDFDPGINKFLMGSRGSNDIFISKLDVSGNLIWAKQLGGLYDDAIYSLALDKVPNIYVSGDFTAEVDFDPGEDSTNLVAASEKDAFILKLNGDGQFLWVKQISGTGYESANAIMSDENQNVYVAGDYSDHADLNPGPDDYLVYAEANDNFVMKLDINGNLVWVTTTGGIEHKYIDGLSVVNVNGKNEIYVLGQFMDSVFFGDPAQLTLKSLNNSQDIYLARIDDEGNFQAVVQIGGYSSDLGTSLVAKNTFDHTDLYLTGLYRNRIQDFDPGPDTFLISATSGFNVFVLKLSDLITGVNQPEEGMIDAGLHVVPNPANDEIRIDIPFQLPTRVQLIDMMGNVLLNTYTYGTDKIIIVDISEFKSGMYIVRMINGDIYRTEKIIIQR
ncbi:MAG: T9SS type A sorting domain-containing protein [Saprospiraceae bacterium]|uniref:T9SS type A sorting domain-containing protein n=1 Tax=Candidatus Opimibacter skivensis TaxID=2982028 RepID=A0A9D7SU56_9BACT|nr:T9SS type A sorting domain-containing protein [Candidatus Opimibacter skivensis]